MRSVIRLLLVGVLLCIGLQVSEVKSVHAGGRLPAGNYIGVVKLTAKLYTQQKYSNEGNIFSSTLSGIWEMKDTIQIRVTKSGKASLVIKGTKRSVSVRSGSINYTAGGGKECTWLHRIAGQGSFLSVETAPLPGTKMENNNYEPDMAFFTVNPVWLGVSNWLKVEGESYGSVEECPTRWGPELAELQKKSTNEMSRQIKEFFFMIENVNQGIIKGTCTLSGWEGKKEINYGTSERTVQECSWHAFRTKK